MFSYLPFLGAFPASGNARIWLLKPRYLGEDAEPRLVVAQVQSFRHSDRTENSVSTVLLVVAWTCHRRSLPLPCVKMRLPEFLRQVLRNYLLEFSAVTMDDPALVQRIGDASIEHSCSI